MIAVIGEMSLSFFPEGDKWVKKFSGKGYEWARKLKCDEDVVFLSVLPMGDTGKEMAECLISNGIVFDPEMRSPLNPSIQVGKEIFIRGSAPITLSAERLSDALSYFSDIRSVVVSASLLSFNPSASAVLDALSFAFPQPRVAVDTDIPPLSGSNPELLDRTITQLKAVLKECLVSDSESEILSFLR